MPTVTISGATAAVVGSTLSLSSAGSAAPTGRAISSHQWSVVGGHTSIAGSSTSATVTLSASSVGFDEVTLVVTDNYGAQTSRSYWVAVNAVVTPASDAPTPVISLSQASVMTGGSLVASGTLSTSKQGTTLSYGWQLLNTSASLSGATDGDSIQVVAGNSTGNLPLVLTVDDGTNQRSVVSNVAIEAVHPAAALNASATNVLVSQRIALDASLSTATTGRSVVGYQWSIVSGHEHADLVGTTTAAAIELQGVSVGKVRVQVVVTDSAGATDTRTLDIYVDTSGAVGALTGPGGGGGAVDAWMLLGLGALLALGSRRARRFSAGAR